MNEFGRVLVCQRANTFCTNCRQVIPVGGSLQIMFPSRRPHCLDCVEKLTSEDGTVVEQPKESKPSKPKQSKPDKVEASSEVVELLRGLYDKLDAVISGQVELRAKLVRLERSDSPPRLPMPSIELNDDELDVVFASEEEIPF